jgi:hypothetical protein
VVREVGVRPSFSVDVRDHLDLASAKGCIDAERATKVADSRFVYRMRDLALVEMALYRFAIDADGKGPRKAAEEQGLRIRARLVEYFDERRASGSVPQNLLGFVKRAEPYGVQREFRIVVPRENPKQEVLWLDLTRETPWAMPRQSMSSTIRYYCASDEGDEHQVA